jgi:hypothetical protein
MAKAYAGATWESEVVDAAMNPLAVTDTNVPFVGHSDRQFGVAPLYKSRREIALLGDKMVAPNMGHLPAGLIMKLTADGRVVPADFSVACTANGATLTVAEADAAYFTVGDVLDCGTVTAIAAPAGGKVAITLAKAPDSAPTAIQFAGETLCILDQAVVSGKAGAWTSVAYSNMVLYAAQVRNATDELLTALGAVVDGPYIIVK